jgi:hypothetical protein
MGAGFTNAVDAINLHNDTMNDRHLEKEPQ